MRDQLFSLPQYLLPHHLLGRVMFKLARWRWPLWKNALIRGFIRKYNVNMELAENSTPTNYASFNDFFTRSLRPEVRPWVLATDFLGCPVDGRISQRGRICDGRIFQAKQRNYSLLELLGGAENLANSFQEGFFVTIYLSPRDYHRIHMPLSGYLRTMLHVPGRLFSVNPPTTRTIPRLFARNERVVTLFETPLGPMALVLVGALFVSSMETVWHGVVTSRKSKTVQRWDYPGKKQAKETAYKQGQEMGRFNMGSTVILLFPEKAGIVWDKSIEADKVVQMGQALARCNPILRFPVEITIS